MDEKINNLPEEDFPLKHEKLSGNERTKKFLKKLEIQHKLLRRMINNETTGLPSESETDDPVKKIQPDTRQFEQ